MLASISPSEDAIDIPIRGDAPSLSYPAVLHLPNIEEVPGTYGVASIGRYALRPLAIAGPRQWMLVPEDLVSVAVETLSYLKEQGFSGMPESQIVPFERVGGAFSSDVLASAALLRRLRRLPVERLEPFVVTGGAEIIAESLGLPLAMSAEVSRKFNHKFQSRRWLEGWGISTPGGVLVRQPDVTTVKQVVRRMLTAHPGDRVGVTIPESCSGVGIYRLRSSEEVEGLFNTSLRGVEEVLVEPWLPGVIGSPSVQVWIDENPDGDYIVGVTDQLLRDEGGGGPTHLGNLVPSQFMAPMMPIILRTMAALRAGGVRGLAGADLIVRRLPDGRLDWQVVEINARQTGAIYGAILGHRAMAGRPGHAFIHNNISVPAGISLDEVIQALEQAGIHWRPGRRDGVIITCAAALACGKLMVVAIGSSRERVTEIIEATRSAPYGIPMRGAA